MNQQKIQMHHGFVFPKEQRYLYETAMLIFVLGLVIVILAGIVSGEDMWFVWSYGCILIGIGMILLTVNNFRFRAIRFATYSIAKDAVSLKYGRKQVSFQRNEEYRLSTIRLNRSIGKGLPMQEPYLVFWKDTHPTENIDPVKLIQSGSVLLLPRCLLDEIRLWSNHSEIPQFPDFVSGTRYNQIIEGHQGYTLP